MKTKRINDEVIVIDEPVASLSRKAIKELVQMAEKNERKRMRICVHRDETEKHQEMFIVHVKDVYVRPHKHLSKVESFLVLEGTANILLFNESGDITEVMKMGDYASGATFYYRLAAPVFHSLIVTSDYLIFKESTTGPFVRQESVFASWSPEESDPAAVAAFKKDLQKKLLHWK